MEKLESHHKAAGYKIVVAKYRSNARMKVRTKNRNDVAS